MSILERRLAKIEAVLNPPQPKPAHLLAEPLEGASSEEWERYRQQLAEAKATGGMVIVLTPVRPVRNENGDGVKYCQDKFDAALEFAAASPSSTGKGALLDDILNNRKGYVLGAVNA